MVTENEDIISKVQLGKATITLLGTAHVSKESVALVEKKIMSGEKIPGPERIAAKRQQTGPWCDRVYRIEVVWSRNTLKKREKKPWND